MASPSGLQWAYELTAGRHHSGSEDPEGGRKAAGPQHCLRLWGSPPTG